MVKQYLIGGIVGVLIAGGLFVLYEQVDHRHKSDKDYKTEYTSDTKTHSHSDDKDGHDHDHGELEAGAFVTVAPAVSVAPISHASAILRWNNQLILADPVGAATSYQEFGTPDVVFVTHRHGDHLDNENLSAMVSSDTVLLVPQDVADLLPADIAATVQVIAPGETQIIKGLTFEAVAAYNTRAEAQNFHPQSRGDVGFVISDGSSRIYFSGDTEGTSEMAALENIDAAFVAMNLPYTMSVEDAAAAVLSFSPKTVYPYHFRTPEGFSDVSAFQALIAESEANITVEILDWYPEPEAS